MAREDSSSGLRGLVRNWEELGRSDPLGAILVDPGRTEPWRLDEFFESGEREIAELMRHAEELGLPRARGDALDFGCGVGRLSQALAERFDRVVGVDVAPTMVELARRHNRHGVRCRYLLNQQPSLAALADGSFDLVYTNMTLQHMEPALAERYVGELVRVLRPSGLLVFQLPSGPTQVAPLPRDGFRAGIELLEPPLRLAAGAEHPLRVRVRNLSPHRWASHKGGYLITVGNHWLGRLGRMVVRDDARRLLPKDVEPGETVEVELRVTAPARPGRYTLEVDLVQEEIAWFRKRGSRTARTPVEVTPARNEAGEVAEAPFRPRMEMYAVPRPRVEELLAGAGARLLAVVENDAAGPGWVSLRYSATL